MSLLCNGTDGYAASVAALAGFPDADANQTISVWFKYSSSPSGSKTLFSLSNSGSSSGVRLGFSNPGSGTTPSVRKFDGTVLAQAASLPSTNVWHHMAYTFDGTTHRLYIDGVADGTSTTAANTATPDNMNFARNSDNTEFFAGNIDDARVYSRVLTANGIQTLANCQGHDGITAGMVGRWGFRAGAKPPSGVGYAYAEVTSLQSHTGDVSYTDIPGASIGSSNFVTGRKYLLVVNGQYRKDPAGLSVTNPSMRVVHGSTAFEGAESKVRGDTSNETMRTFTFFVVWTAVSGEAIKAQYRTLDSTQTVQANFVTLLALDLTRFREGVDWHFNENTTDTAIDTTTWSTTNNGTVTFTPETAGHDWLVMTLSDITAPAAGANQESRINRSGEAASTLPMLSQEAYNTADIQLFCNMRVYNLGASSNTFAEQSRQDLASGAPVRIYSSVFAIDLDKFPAHEDAYTEATVSLSTTDYATQVQSVSISMTAAAHLWALATFAADGSVSLAGYFKGRIQIDNSDSPAGQTSASYERMDIRDATDKTPIQNQTVALVSSGSRAVDFDGSVDPGITGTAEYRAVMAVQLEPGSVVDDLSVGGTYVVLAGTASFGDTALARRRRVP